MRYIICIFFILQSISLSSQVKNKSNINQNEESIIKSRTELVQSQLQKLDSMIIDLKNQLIIYKAKEDYYAAALGDQSNRFVLIVSVFVASLGIISFSWYKIEKKKIKKRFKSFGEEFKVIKNENTKLESNLYLTSANAFALIAYTFRKSKHFTESFEYNLIAARDHYKSLKLIGEDDYKVVINILEGSLKDFDEINKNISLKDEISKKRDLILKYIETLQNAENGKIKNLCADIRVSLNNYLK